MLSRLKDSVNGKKITNYTNCSSPKTVAMGTLILLNSQILYLWCTFSLLSSPLDSVSLNLFCIIFFILLKQPCSQISWKSKIT